MRVLITGVAGFIGYHFAQRLLAEGLEVYGIDNLNDYYDVSLKKDRLSLLASQSRFNFQHLDLANREGIIELFETIKFTHVVNLAAQAGVRYSLQNPFAYADSNLSGFINLLEGCRRSQVQHLVFASSSSVYGANTKVPFSVGDRVDQPISLYAATKKANELIAHTYSHLYSLPTTGLRFFTVYGPWGRPDMAYFKFVQAIDTDTPIDVYNFGKMKRDFTYIDDVVEGIFRVMYKPPQYCSVKEDYSSRQAGGAGGAGEEKTSLTEQYCKPPQETLPTSASETALNRQAPYKLYNIGNNSPVELITFIETIEKALGKTAQKNFLPMQPGDVPCTYADVDELIKDVGFKPGTPLETGMQRFVQWYQDYYKSSQH